MKYLHRYFRSFTEAQARDFEIFFNDFFPGLDFDALLVGNLTGNVVGNITGDQVGERTDVKTSYVADTNLGDTDFPTQFIELDANAAAVQISNWTPTIGRMYVVYCKDASNTVTLALSSGMTFEGTNDLATFDAANETLVLYAITATRVIVVENIGSIVFS